MRGRPKPCVCLQIRVACDRIVRRLKIREISLIHGVSARTVYRWVDVALTLDEPEAEALRRLSDGRNGRNEGGARFY